MAGAEDLLPLIATCLPRHFDEDHGLHLPTPLRTAEGEGEIPPHITGEEWEIDVCREVLVREGIQEVEARDYGVCLVGEVEVIGRAGGGHDHRATTTGNDSEVGPPSLAIARHAHDPP
jgi:hypothetical protein